MFWFGGNSGLMWRFSEGGEREHNRERERESGNL